MAISRIARTGSLVYPLPEGENRKFPFAQRGWSKGAGDLAMDEEGFVADSTSVLGIQLASILNPFLRRAPHHVFRVLRTALPQNENHLNFRSRAGHSLFVVACQPA